MTNEERAHELAMFAAKAMTPSGVREEGPAKTAAAYNEAYKAVMDAAMTPRPPGQSVYHCNAMTMNESTHPNGVGALLGAIVNVPKEVRAPGFVHADGTLHMSPE